MCDAVEEAIMRVDVHAHHLPAAYMKMLEDGDGPMFGAAHDEATLRAMIEGQDESGVSLQILSTGPNSPYLRDAERARAAAAFVNDAYLDVVQRHGGRFAAFGSLPLPHGDAATKEAVRCLDVLGFAGIHVGCSALGRSLGDPAFADLWVELNRRDAIIYVHPGGILCGSEPGLAGMEDPGIAVTIGSAAEIATAALQMAAIHRVHGRLRVIIGLLGGALPFLMQRVAWLGARFKGRSILAEDDLAGSLRCFSYDTNLLPDPAAIVAARQAFGVDRLLFGSDAPALAPAVTLRFMRDGGLSDEECRQILCDNPARLFGPAVLGRSGAA